MIEKMFILDTGIHTICYSEKQHLPSPKGLLFRLRCSSTKHTVHCTLCTVDNFVAVFFLVFFQVFFRPMVLGCYLLLSCLYEIFNMLTILPPPYRSTWLYGALLPYFKSLEQP